MTIHQEIKKILQTQGKSTVDEDIIPELIESINQWTVKLLGRLSTLDIENKKQVERTYNRIRNDLVGETIKGLIKYQNEGEKVEYIKI